MKVNFSGILLCALIISSATKAATYYVDATNGNDAASGITTTKAWKTLAQVNKTALLAGDTVKLKCGEVWRESLNLNHAGNSTQRITYGNYGTTCSTKKPEIRGANQMTGWTQYSGNIYVAALPYNGDVTQVFVDGSPIQLAKHPNSGSWSIAQNSTSGGSCAVHSAPYDPISFIGTCTVNLALSANHPEVQSNDLTGAGIHIKTQAYWVDNNSISSYDGSSAVSLDNLTRFTPSTGNTYYLDNKLWMLDQADEWFYDKNQGKLYVWLPEGSNPNNHTVEASNIGYGVYAANQSAAGYITLNGLLINDAAIDGIHVENAANIKITNTDIRNSRNDGILVYQSNGASLISNAVSSSGREGIKLRQSTSATISNNTVIDSGTTGFYVGAFDSSFGAIAADSSSGASITKNTVTNSGYIGVRIQNGSIASYNKVNNSCLTLSDCGAIYVNGTSQTSTDFVTTIKSNSIINSGLQASTELVAGIYLDDFANNVSTSRNTVSGAERGIFLHLAHDNTVSGNTVYGSRNYALSISENISPSYVDVTRNNSVTSNIFFPTITKEAVNFYGSYSNISFANFDKNTYSTVYNDTAVVASYNPSTGYVMNAYTLPKWQSLAQQDINSTAFSPFKISSYRVLSTLGGEYIANGTFDADVNSWTSWSQDGTATREWVANCNNSGGCQKFTASTTATSLTSSNYFNLQQGRTYELKIKLLSTASVRAIVRRDGGFYESIGMDNYLNSDSQWKSYSFAFTANATLSNALFQLEANNGQSVLFDDISVHEITADYNDPGDDSRIIINTASTQTTFNCPDTDTDTSRCGQYIDLSGNTVSWPVTLPAYSSRIIVWSANPFVTQ